MAPIGGNPETATQAAKSRSETPAAAPKHNCTTPPAQARQPTTSGRSPWPPLRPSPLPGSCSARRTPTVWTQRACDRGRDYNSQRSPGFGAWVTCSKGRGPHTRPLRRLGGGPRSSLRSGGALALREWGVNESIRGKNRLEFEGRLCQVEMGL